jgi:D-tyrosyl-tRNA(Tyr) deacylase
VKIIVQRVSEAEVVIDNKINAKIKKGILILVGFTHNDTIENVKWMCNKILGLRIFSDTNGKMNLSVQDINGEILIVSNFTLYGESNKGYRPNFTSAAKPEIALPLYNSMIQSINEAGINVETGIFGAMMDVKLINDGPVTIILER